MKKFLPLVAALLLVPLIWLAWVRFGPPATPEAPRVTEQWYKGNTHTHSLWSDGNDFPEMIVDWYRQRDYHFLSLSDHNILSRGEMWMTLTEVERRRKTVGRPPLEKYRQRFGKAWVETRGDGEALEIRLKALEEFRPQFEKPGEFLLIEGEEISAGFEKAAIHLNAINLAELIPAQKGDSVQDTIRNNLRAAKKQEETLGRPILVHINHPNFVWSLTPADIAHVVEEDFFEVYNGHPIINHLGDETRPSDEELWDIANTIRMTELDANPLYGLATDDSHTYHGGDVSPGRGWVMVHASELTAEALITAMRAGDFYASSGITLADLSYAPEKRELRFRIESEPGEEYTTAIIGTERNHPEAVGKTLATLQGTDVVYRLTGKELYVRATVTSSKAHDNPSFQGQKKQAWTQPVGWR